LEFRVLPATGCPWRWGSTGRSRWRNRAQKYPISTSGTSGT